MSNEVTTPKTTGLGALNALNALKTGLNNVKASIPAVGGKPLLRMLNEKDGWVFGQENNALPLGTEIVFNTLTLHHGYVCWTDRGGKEKNELLDERYWSVAQPLPQYHEMPEMKDPKTGAVCQWKRAYKVEGKILSGKHKGTEVAYKPSSMGGEQAVGSIIAAITDKMGDDPNAPIPPFILPICELRQKEPYANQSGGRTYPPDFPVVGWMDLEGNEEDADDDGAPEPVTAKLAAPEPEPAPVVEEEAPRRRRRV
jgi:hypothetical protein